MIEMKRAADLLVGDVFSTDGYKVESVCVLWDGRISVSAWLDASGGIHKSAVLDADAPMPIWTPDEAWQIEAEHGARMEREYGTQ
jgi:hypothetical protein